MNAVRDHRRQGAVNRFRRQNVICLPELHVGQFGQAIPFRAGNAEPLLVTRRFAIEEIAHQAGNFVTLVLEREMPSVQ